MNEDDDESLAYGRESPSQAGGAVDRPVPDADLRFFANGYLNRGNAVDNFMTWFGCFDNAREIEAEPQTSFEDYNLTAQQMGEGARVRARHYAVMVAVKPADTLADLGFKIMMEMTMAREQTEWRRSHVLEMLRAAIEADMRSLGVQVAPYTMTAQ